MNLRTLDLNLLVVFDALMRERHVTRAANAIGLSQPSVSNALSRLRDRLGDELFIRTTEGMQPTSWAQELSGPISAALGEIENALDAASFDPANSERTFTIAAPDYATITLFPRLLARMRKEAPGVGLRVITPSIHIGEFLDTQKADLALFNWPDPPERFESVGLFAEDWVVVMRSGHPMAGKRMTLNQFTELDHFLIAPQAERKNWVDDALAKQDRARRVAYSIPTYGPAPLILETTDLVLTCPGSVGRVYQNYYQMVVSECPVETPPSARSIDMNWHSRLGNHPAQTWLRDLLREIGQQGAD